MKINRSLNKRLLLFIVVFMLETPVLPQYNMDVTLTNGDTISGFFKWKKRKLVNRTTKKVIYFDSIDNFSTKFEDFTNRYYVVYYVFNGNIKNARQALGYKVYTGQTVEMFYINFGNYVRDTPHRTNHSLQEEIFIRRRGVQYV